MRRYKLLRAFFIANAVIVFAVFGVMLGFIVLRALPAVDLTLLFSESRVYPEESFGLAGSLVNTFYFILLSLFFGMPAGIAAALYLSLYCKSAVFARVSLWATGLLSAVPPILIGLFGSVFFYRLFGISILSGSLTLAVIVFPLTVQLTLQAVSMLPRELSLSARALGAATAGTIPLILRQIRPQLVSSAILASSRVTTECAALMLTAGIAATLPENPLTHIFRQGGSLAVQLYQYAIRGAETEAQAYFTAVVLVGMSALLSRLAKIVKS